MILYASLGMGHISAANALSQAFSHPQFAPIEVLSEDALAYASSVYRNAVIQAYKNSSEKVPQLYKALYEGSDISDLERSLDSNLAWAKLELPFFRRLGRLIRETAPDAIVCVQQIPSRLLQLLEPEDQVSKPQYVE
jgi:processive 1,2-diacylglycerol beta-glucosyltransferase